MSASTEGFAPGPQAHPAGMDGPLSVSHLGDLDGRVEALVHVSEPRYLRTTTLSGFAPLLLERLPGLRRHRCECGSARGIEAELADTELPHALEHVALELMVLDGAPRSLRGETSWDFKRDGKGVFRVSLAYRDDETGFDDPALAEDSLRAGARLINSLVNRIVD